MKCTVKEAVYSCPCPEGKHALDLHNPVALQLHRVIEEKGGGVTVLVRGKGSWLVPRIYIAIHGVTEEDMEEGRFPRVPENEERVCVDSMIDAPYQDRDDI